MLFLPRPQVLVGCIALMCSPYNPGEQRLLFTAFVSMDDRIELVPLLKLAIHLANRPLRVGLRRKLLSCIYIYILSSLLKHLGERARAWFETLGVVR